MLKKFCIALCMCVACTFPFIIYYGISNQVLEYILPVVACLYGIRLALTYKNKTHTKYLSILSLIAICAFAIVVLCTDNDTLMLYYPVAVNAIFLIVFGGSLCTSTSIVTRFAMLQKKELQDYVISYTRKVTIAWCVFFVVNGAIALYSAIFCSLKVWTAYNGCISYILMGALALCEYIVRIYIKKKHEYT